MDPLGLGMRDLRGEIEIVQPMSRPGTVGAYLGTQRVHKVAGK